MKFSIREEVLCLLRKREKSGGGGKSLPDAVCLMVRYNFAKKSGGGEDNNEYLFQFILISNQGSGGFG